MIPFCPSCNEPLPRTDIPLCPVCTRERPERFGWPRDSLLHKKIDHGQWTVQRRIGSGGFAVVYKVIETTTGIARAMKVLNSRFSQSREVQRRFWAEIHTFRKLKHRNIVHFHKAGLLSSARPFMIMDLIQGLSLRKMILPSPEQPPQRMPVKRAAGILEQVVCGLRAAHELNLLHRDLNPNNVLITTDTQGGDYARIIDYGVAKLLGKNTVDRITHHIVGTPEFMAPEQFHPGEELSFALDIWQAGALLFFLLTGQSPYPPPKNPADLIRVRAQMEERRERLGPAPSELLDDLEAHSALDSLTATMLSTDPSKRPNTSQILTSLRSYTHQTTPDPRATQLELKIITAPSSPIAFCPRCQQTTPPTSSQCVSCTFPTPSRGWPRDQLLHTAVHGQTLYIAQRLRTTRHAVVYETRNTETQERTALKIYHSNAKHLPVIRHNITCTRDTFLSLHHPNILPIRDMGILSETLSPFVLTAPIHGRTLFDHIWARGVNTPSLTDPVDTLRVGLQIASALEIMHQHTLLHLNLTPKHIALLCTPQNSLHPTLLDIEEATILHGTHADDTLDLGQTLPFCPPELFTDAQPTSHSCDLFQLGACLHALLTGWPPYLPKEASSPHTNLTCTELAQQHRAPEHAQGVSPNRYNPALRIWGGISQVVASMLAPLPQNRPPSARNAATILAETLQRCLHILTPRTYIHNNIPSISDALSGDFDFSFSHDDTCEEP